MRRSVTWAKHQVVVVPFPFTDQANAKLRPALVLSPAAFAKATGHVILAMITTKGDWRWDVEISDLETAGLNVACKVRMKIMTVDQTLIRRAIGELGKADRAAVSASLEACIGN